MARNHDVMCGDVCRSVGASSCTLTQSKALDRCVRVASALDPDVCRSVGAGSSTLTRSLLAQMMPLHADAPQQAEPAAQQQVRAARERRHHNHQAAAAHEQDCSDVNISRLLRVQK